MIVKWGRNSVIAGALAFTFISPTPTTVNEVQVKQGHRLEFRHLTPETTTANGLNLVQVRPSYKLEFRHLTPVAEAGGKSRPHNLMSDHDMILREDQELLELITMLASIDGF